MFSRMFFRTLFVTLLVLVLLPLVGCREPVYYADTGPPPVVYTEYNYFGVPYYYWYWGGVRYHSYRHPHRHHHRHYPILPPPHVRRPAPHRSVVTDPPTRGRELRRPERQQSAPPPRLQQQRPASPPAGRPQGRDVQRPRERPR
ncbi:MAG TPA: hypothetical protein VJ579_04415 [Candidatus Paceibacterota bacterium]|nr:hypothetical protein [Candidatus Paceibacterota bacterium]